MEKVLENQKRPVLPSLLVKIKSPYHFSTFGSMNWKLKYLILKC